MDFIARAGGILAYSHRLLGVVLIIVIFQTVTIVSLLNDNKELNLAYEQLRNELKVYVVPGSQADLYSPSKGEMLLDNFTQHVTQSLLTYSYANLESQYREIQKFFTPEMLVLANNYYSKLIQRSRQDERSSLFVPDKNKTKVENIPDPDNPDETMKKVTIYGQVQYILGSTVVEAAPMEVILHARRTFINQTNPFGYKLAYYKENEIKKK